MYPNLNSLLPRHEPSRTKREKKKKEKENYLKPVSTAWRDGAGESYAADENGLGHFLPPNVLKASHSTHS